MVSFSIIKLAKQNHLSINRLFHFGSFRINIGKGAAVGSGFLLNPIGTILTFIFTACILI
jgi:hypothetical protein